MLTVLLSGGGSSLNLADLRVRLSSAYETSLFEGCDEDRGYCCDADADADAEKPTESAQDVGIALTVLSGDDLLKQNVTRINDLQYAIPDAKLIVYPGAGHLPQVEIPARSTDDVAAFLEAHGSN